MSTQQQALEEEIACIERELALRQTVYARRVATGKMRQAQMDKEIALMERIRQRLAALLGAEMAEPAAQLDWLDGP